MQPALELHHCCHVLPAFAFAMATSLRCCPEPVTAHIPFDHANLLVISASGTLQSFWIGCFMLVSFSMTGTLRSCDPDRVVLKKIVLSGYPVKVHKKKAVVRWMFHNPEDVRWFKPLELWTKYGRRGRIKVKLDFEKCHFAQSV